MVYFEDTLHYCLTEPFTKFLVKEYRQNEIHKGIIIKLEQRVLSDSIRIDALERSLEISMQIESEQDSIIDIGEQELELTEKELKRQIRRARWQKAWAYIKYPLIAAGAAAAGYGIGRIPH